MTCVIMVPWLISCHASDLRGSEKPTLDSDYVASWLLARFRHPVLALVCIGTSFGGFCMQINFFEDVVLGPAKCGHSG